MRLKNIYRRLEVFRKINHSENREDRNIAPGRFLGKLRRKLFWAVSRIIIFFLRIKTGVSIGNCELVVNFKNPKYGHIWASVCGTGYLATSPVWSVKVLSSHNMTPDAEHCTYLLLGISFALLCNGNAMIKCNQSASVHTELQVKMAENKKEMLICDLNMWQTHTSLKAHMEQGTFQRKARTGFCLSSVSIAPLWDERGMFISVCACLQSRLWS